MEEKKIGSLSPSVCTMVREYLDHEPSIDLMGHLLIMFGEGAVQNKSWPNGASPELLGYVVARIVDTMKQEVSSKYDHELFFQGYEQGRYGIDKTVLEHLENLVGK